MKEESTKNKKTKMTAPIAKPKKQADKSGRGSGNRDSDSSNWWNDNNSIKFSDSRVPSSAPGYPSEVDGLKVKMKEQKERELAALEEEKRKKQELEEK